MTESPSEPPDAAIVEQSLREPGAFRELYLRHADAIYRYLAARVGPAAAEDLCSEAFLIAFDRRVRFDRSASSVRPWLYGIASNLLLRHRAAEADWLRRSRHTVVGVDLEDADAETVSRVDAARMRVTIRFALAELSPEDREVLVLYAVSDLSYPQIAVALDVPVGTVRSRLHRARAHMRSALQSHESHATLPTGDPGGFE